MDHGSVQQKKHANACARKIMKMHPPACRQAQRACGGRLARQLCPGEEGRQGSPQGWGSRLPLPAGGAEGRGPVPGGSVSAAAAHGVGAACKAAAPGFDAGGRVGVVPRHARCGVVGAAAADNLPGGVGPVPDPDVVGHGERRAAPGDGATDHELGDAGRRGVAGDGQPSHGEGVLPLGRQDALVGVVAHRIGHREAVVVWHVAVHVAVALEGPPEVARHGAVALEGGGHVLCLGERVRAGRVLALEVCPADVPVGLAVRLHDIRVGRLPPGVEVVGGDVHRGQVQELGFRPVHPVVDELRTVSAVHDQPLSTEGVLDEGCGGLDPCGGHQTVELQLVPQPTGQYRGFVLELVARGGERVLKDVFHICPEAQDGCVAGRIEAPVEECPAGVSPRRHALREGVAKLPGEGPHEVGVATAVVTVVVGEGSDESDLQGPGGRDRCLDRGEIGVIELDLVHAAHSLGREERQVVPPVDDSRMHARGRVGTARPPWTARIRRGCGRAPCWRQAGRQDVLDAEGGRVVAARGAPGQPQFGVPGWRSASRPSQKMLMSAKRQA
mmetsp:Transcript_41884/g.125183  ORF Transcript_41884/g.125183 Transcript_41884/m.125183 type:complete len:556 (-) Transcript_41884:203-1870(-)